MYDVSVGTLEVYGDVSMTSLHANLVVGNNLNVYDVSIGTLDVGNVIIEGTLNAYDVSIENLIVNYISINGTMISEHINVSENVSANSFLSLHQLDGFPENTATTITVGSKGWFGGVLAPNGKIYGIPYFATSILEIKTGLPIHPPWMLQAYFNKF